MIHFHRFELFMSANLQSTPAESCLDYMHNNSAGEDAVRAGRY
jgi:hypothetical protein